MDLTIGYPPPKLTLKKKKRKKGKKKNTIDSARSVVFCWPSAQNVNAFFSRGNVI